MNTSTVDDTHVIYDSGVKYTIKVKKGTNGTSIVIRNSKTKNYTIERIDKSKSHLTVTNYIYEGKTITGVDKCDKYADSIDLSRVCYAKAVIYFTASGIGIGIMLD